MSVVAEHRYEMHDAKRRNSHRQQKNLDGIALGLPVFLSDSQNDQNKSTHTHHGDGCDMKSRNWKLEIDFGKIDLD